MIRRPEDLPQKALFRAKPNGRRNQGRGQRGQRLDALRSRQADMERSSSTDLNQVSVVVPHK
jgi:hypothetical protein